MIVIAMILKTAFSIVLVSMVARFLAQMARADFYNPLAQTVIKITDPFVKPLRRVIPSIAGFDTASIIAMLLGQIILGVLMFFVSGINPAQYLPQILIWGIIAVAALILTVIQWSMIIVGVSSFILMGQYNPFIAFIAKMIEPFVGPFRRLNLQVGMLDLSFLIAFFVIIIIKDVILIEGVANFVGYSRSYGFFIGL
ncbi:YggT family protein [Reinekea sp. G2M2-21]|jgi:YggT family protein|uniref:YggT family protein n=1 Tax=Reinekea sp. G2M2-21 TaxID=2788942 RepID=UPI0018AA115D|nr:YggT family protein [Reinekea sp. G2M2-21]MDX1341780.1 YggT family protein [Reinekea sp.]